MLHHSKSSVNRDLKRSINHNNGVVIPAINLCNVQPEKNLGTLTWLKGRVMQINQKKKCQKDNIDVDMVILGQVDQVLQSLGDPIPEKLAEVVKKYWLYKPEKFSVTKSLNGKFLIPLNQDEICTLRLKEEIFFSKSIAPWKKRVHKRIQESKTSMVKVTAGLIKFLESNLRLKTKLCG